MVGVDGTAQYHFRGRRSRCTPTAAGGTVCVHSNPQRHRLTTSRYCTAPFNKAPLYPSRRRVCFNVHHQFTPSSKLHAPPLLYYQQQHRLASRLPPPHINVARAIRFSFTSQKLQHSNTCATSRPHRTFQQLRCSSSRQVCSSTLLTSVDQIYYSLPPLQHYEHNNAIH